MVISDSESEEVSVIVCLFQMSDAV